MEQEAITQEPSLQGSDIEATTQTVCTLSESQKLDVVTQEPTSSKLFAKDTTQTEVVGDETHKRDAATQEPTFPKLFVESSTQTEAPREVVEVEILLEKGKGEDKRGKREQ